MIKTRICEQKFALKPVDNQVSGISFNLSTCANKTLTVEQLADHIAGGASFSPSHYSEGRSSKGFLRSNTLCLDYDECNYSFSQLLGNFDKKPAIAYESFSSSEANRKWRLIFICDRDMTNVAELKGNLRLLATGTPYDKSCIDAARLFYGTNKRVRILDYDLITPVVIKPELATPVVIPEFAPRTVYSSRKANIVVNACERFFHKSVGSTPRRQIIFFTATKFFSSGLFTLEQVEQHILSFAADFDREFFSSYDKDCTKIINDCYDWLSKNG